MGHSDGLGLTADFAFYYPRLQSNPYMILHPAQAQRGVATIRSK